MGINRSLATFDEREQRAALRDSILQCGRQVGWPTRTSIAFTEQIARRPWKRCTRAELSAVFDELHAILWAFESRMNTRPATLSDRAATRPRRGNRRARPSRA